MERKNLILGAASGVIFLIAIVYYVTRPSAGADTPRSIKANCACLACRQPVFVEAAVTEPRPYTCPECGERAVYPVLVCRKCGKYFVPNLVPFTPIEGIEEEGFPSTPIMPSCPACGSSDVRGYTGDEPPTADQLLLPKWPL